MAAMDLPVMPPLRPMLAKATEQLPPDDDMVFEPKWDGFRCLVFRDGDEVELGSRNDRPLTRYFPELLDPIRAMLPQRCVVDGEVVVVSEAGLDFDRLGQRIHPAKSRVDRLAVETPASFVAFDLVALDDRDLRDEPFVERRRLLAEALHDATAPIHLCPTTRDREVAADWFARFEGAGFDGVMAKPAQGTYVSDKRVQWKVKHKRTADLVVAGYRVHKDGHGVGSLLLGVFDDDGHLQHIGVAAAFTAARREELVGELAPYEEGALDGHPWRQWAEAEAHEAGPTRMPGAPSRWSGGKDQSWVPVRPELVVEVAYEGLTNGRFRHPARFVRWRPDKAPEECRYDQMDHPAPAELQQIFGGTNSD
jgi:ATP-dependent DNA ligase